MKKMLFLALLAAAAMTVTGCWVYYDGYYSSYHPSRTVHVRHTSTVPTTHYYYDYDYYYPSKRVKTYYYPYPTTYYKSYPRSYPRTYPRTYHRTRDPRPTYYPRSGHRVYRR